MGSSRSFENLVKHRQKKNTSQVQSSFECDRSKLMREGMIMLVDLKIVMQQDEAKWIYLLSQSPETL